MLAKPAPRLLSVAVEHELEVVQRIRRQPGPPGLGQQPGLSDVGLAHRAELERRATQVAAGARCQLRLQRTVQRTDDRTQRSCRHA